jgi:uncharacterized protein YuzE
MRYFLVGRASVPALLLFYDGRDKIMKICYFPDTDTALIEFSSAPAVETREINENFYIDLDQDGNLVSMTVEHARTKADISEVSFLQMV